MKTHLKFAIAGLALLASLGFGSAAQAATSTPQASTPQVVIAPLAWQRVGAPTSMEA